MNELDKETTLFDFIRICWCSFKNFLKKIGCLSLKSIRLSLQYYWVTIIFVLIGFSAGYYWTRTSSTIYTGETTITFNDGMRPQIENGINLFFGTDREILEDYYNIPKELGENIKEVKISRVIDAKKDLSPDYIDYDNKTSPIDSFVLIMTDRVNIKIKMKGSPDFSIFNHSINQFLKDQKSIAIADSAYRRSLHDKIEMYDREISRLDSFISYEYFQKPFTIKISSFTESDNLLHVEMGMRHNELFHLRKMKCYLQSLEDKNPEIINMETGFIVSAMQPLHKWIICLVVSIILSLLTSLMIKHRESIKAYMKNRN